MSASMYLRRITEDASDAECLRVLTDAIEDAARGVITLDELVELARAI